MAFSDCHIALLFIIVGLSFVEARPPLPYQWESTPANTSTPVNASCQGSLKDPTIILKHSLPYIQEFTPIHVESVAKGPAHGNQSFAFPAQPPPGCNETDLRLLPAKFGLLPWSPCQFRMRCQYSSHRFPPWMYKAVKEPYSSCYGSKQCKARISQVPVLYKTFVHGCPVWMRSFEHVLVQYRCVPVPNF